MPSKWCVRACPSTSALERELVHPHGFARRASSTRVPCSRGLVNHTQAFSRLVAPRLILPLPGRRWVVSHLRSILIDGIGVNGVIPHSTSSPCIYANAAPRNFRYPLAQPLVSPWMQPCIGEPSYATHIHRQIPTISSTTVKLWLPCVLFLYLFPQVNAVNLNQCRATFTNRTHQSVPLKMTYSQCVETCGGGPGEFQWTMFSQSFSSWLLPWIALIFQLPFGATGTPLLANNHMDKG